MRPSIPFENWLGLSKWPWSSDPGLGDFSRLGSSKQGRQMYHYIPEKPKLRRVDPFQPNLSSTYSITLTVHMLKNQGARRQTLSWAFISYLYQENPCRHREKVQTPHRKTPAKTEWVEPSCCEVTVLTTYHRAALRATWRLDMGKLLARLC